MPFYHGPRLEAVDEMKIPTTPDLYHVAERVILDHYAPAGILVNESHEIVHFMGKTDKFLETPTGKASFNVLNMARKGLKLKLATALNNALRQKKSSVHEALRITYNGGFRIVDLTVRPLTESTLQKNFVLILFEDKTPNEKPHLEKKGKVDKKKSDPVLVGLEEELASTKEHLQTTIEELETSNEELKSTNEELQSVNEEMQSTNEELETSKEELQSTNEELVTVNTELQNKVDELSTANDDINNLLAVTDIGTVFLDTRLCIKRYTPAMKKIFNLIPTDVDRPIGDITAKINYQNLAKDAQQVLDTLVQKEEEVETEDGVWYAIKILPYRTLENVIEGVVITFVDITRMKQWEEIQRLAAVVRDSNDAIMLMDFDGNITAWNKGAEKMYGYREAKAITMNIREIIPPEKVEEAEDFIRKLQRGNLVDSFETQRMTKDGRRLDVRLTVTRLADPEGTGTAIATTERDITGRKG